MKKGQKFFCLFTIKPLIFHNFHAYQTHYDKRFKKIHSVFTINDTIKSM